MTDVIYCADGNKRFAQIAIEHGFNYGAQLPSHFYFPIYFADQNWKKPNREKYMRGLVEHRPYMATVLDWERENQLPEVLDWAEEAAQYVSVVVLIPKVMGGIDRLPRTINGAEVRLGFSVPTKYGGTPLPLWEFKNWPVHLLGGSPHTQLRYAWYVDVRSCDGNYANKMAVQFNQAWVRRGDTDGRFVALAELDNAKWERDAPYEAFRRSCVNIMAAWKEFDQQHAEYAQKVV